MDTTKLEYELKMLQERLAILESQRDKDRSDLNMVVRKTAGAVDPMPDVKQLETRDASKYQKWAVGPFGPEPQFMNPSPKPKFWKCYKAIDRFGNIYLIQNPVCWSYGEDPESNGGKVFRQEKKLVLTAADVAAEIKKLSRVKRDEEKNETPSSFSNI